MPSWESKYSIKNKIFLSNLAYQHAKVFLKFLCVQDEFWKHDFLFRCVVLPFVYIDRAFYVVSNHNITSTYLNYVVT